MRLIRAIKAACTANLIIAIAVVIGYVAYGLASGLPIDREFLNAKPKHLGRGGGPEILSAWELVAFLEAVVFVSFIICHYAEFDMTGHRFLCGFLGVFGLCTLFIHIPHVNYFAEEEIIAFVHSRADRILAWYVWASHAIYALVGPNED